MVKAAFASTVCLILSSAVSTVACTTSEELLGECGASPASASLLQVDRKQVRPTHDDAVRAASVPGTGNPSLARVEEEIHVESNDRSRGSTPGGVEVPTMTEFLRRTKPLQEQLEDVKSDVKSLKADVARQSERKSEKEEDANDSGYNEDDTRKQKRSRDSDDEDNAWQDNYVRNDQDEGFNSGSYKRSRDSDEESKLSSINEEEASANGNNDWAWDNKKGLLEESGNDDEEANDSGDEELPDWEGVAPAPHWNGLEKVQATDSGPYASWKGDGVGVSTGKSYSGEEPYETMMDVDYVIDSNPVDEPEEEPYMPTDPPTENQPTEEMRRRRAPFKPSKSGPKTRPKTSPKAAPKSPAKSEDTRRRRQGKSPSKSPSRGKGKASGKGEASGKTRSKGEASGKSGPRGDAKSKASGSNDAKSGPSNEGKGEASGSKRAKKEEGKTSEAE